MDLPDYIAAAAGGWLVLAALGGTSWALVARGMKRKATSEAEVVNWMPELPPVPWPMKRPPITQADVDSTWATDWRPDVEPADIDTLEQRVFDRLFDDLIAIEGLQ